MKTFPNPTGKEVNTWTDVLNRCQKSETARMVEQWAKQHGIVDLAVVANAKRKTLKRGGR